MPSRVIKYFLPILLFASLSVRAQSIHYLTNEPTMGITPDSIVPQIKVVVGNPYPNTERYRLSLSQPIHFTARMDSFTSKSGMVAHITFKGNSTNTIYVMPERLQGYHHIIHPDIILEKEIVAAHRDSVNYIAWLIAMSLLCCFAAYNLYIYFQLYDRIYLLYLVVQLGAMLYITSFKHFMSALLPSNWYQIRVAADGDVYNYDLNSFFLHLGGTIVLTGFLQLTRSFLRTRELLPGCDRWLKVLSIIYVGYGSIPAIVTISGLFYLDNYTLLFDNIFVLVIGLSMLITSAIAYKKKVRAAGLYLLANILPIVFATGIAVYFIINRNPNYTDNSSVLPEITVISQILTFTIALVARIRTIHEELDAKSYEIARLETDIAQSKHHRYLIEKENEQIAIAMQAEKDRNDQLQSKLDTNNRELVSNSLYIHQKNKLLDDLKKQLHDIDELYPHVKHPGLRSIKSSLQDHQFLDAEWDKFKLHFEQVHPGFFEELKAKYPNLTNNELRLYAYFHINLSTKEIATLLNIEAASVRQAKARLNKKLKISA